MIATGSAEARLARLKDLGAHHVIDYAPATIAEQTRALTDGRGAELVVEMVGGRPSSRGVRDRYRGADRLRGRREW